MMNNPADESVLLNAKLSPAGEVFTQIINALDAQTPGDGYVDYKQLYYFVFNGISDILASEHNTKDALKALQCAAEELYLRMP